LEASCFNTLASVKQAQELNGILLVLYSAGPSGTKVKLRLAHEADEGGEIAKSCPLSTFDIELMRGGERAVFSAERSHAASRYAVRNQLNDAFFSCAICGWGNLSFEKTNEQNALRHTLSTIKRGMRIIT
jgi:hypothetical protein